MQKEETQHYTTIYLYFTVKQLVYDKIYHNLKELLISLNMQFFASNISEHFIFVIFTKSNFKNRRSVLCFRVRRVHKLNTHTR